MRKRFIPTASVLMLLAIAFSVSAQNTNSSQSSQTPATRPARRGPGRKCPVIKVSSPDSVTEGMRLEFVVMLEGGDETVEVTYNWTVSNGTISKGQGTSTVAVDTTGIVGGSVTATVAVGGYSRTCQASASATTMVAKRVESRKVDEYGTLMLATERERLDAFALELNRDPTVQAYILAYGGRRSAATAADTLAARAKKYLQTFRNIDTNRLVTVNGGYREIPTVELYLVPLGATPPTSSPTVDPSEVKAPKTVVKKPASKRKKA